MNNGGQGGEPSTRGFSVSYNARPHPLSMTLVVIRGQASVSYNPDVNEAYKTVVVIRGQASVSYNFSSNPSQCSQL